MAFAGGAWRGARVAAASSRFRVGECAVKGLGHAGEGGAEPEPDVDVASNSSFGANGMSCCTWWWREGEEIGLEKVCLK